MGVTWSGTQIDVPIVTAATTAIVAGTVETKVDEIEVKLKESELGDEKLGEIMAPSEIKSKEKSEIHNEIDDEPVMVESPIEHQRIKELGFRKALPILDCLTDEEIKQLSHITLECLDLVIKINQEYQHLILDRQSLILAQHNIVIKNTFDAEERTAHHNALILQYNTLKEKFDILQVQYKELEARYQKIEQQSTHHEAVADELSVLNKTLDQRIDTLTICNDELTIQCSLFNERVITLEETLKITEKSNEMLNEQLVEQSLQVKTLTTTVNELQQENDRLKKAMTYAAVAGTRRLLAPTIGVPVKNTYGTSTSTMVPRTTPTPTPTLKQSTLKQSIIETSRPSTEVPFHSIINQNFTLKQAPPLYDEDDNNDE
jgi:uncharacterized coiled-coil protein SlyX